VTDIPARLSSTYYSKTDGDLGTSTGGGARDGCLILIPAADAKMAGELLQMADAAKVLLMRTNDCQLSEPWLRTFLTEGGVAANEVAKLAKQARPSVRIRAAISYARRSSRTFFLSDRFVVKDRRSPRGRVRMGTSDHSPPARRPSISTLSTSTTPRDSD
jgi:hypothetical protein